VMARRGVADAVPHALRRALRHQQWLLTPSARPADPPAQLPCGSRGCRPATQGQARAGGLSRRSSTDSAGAWSAGGGSQHALSQACTCSGVASGAVVGRQPRCRGAAAATGCPCWRCPALPRRQELHSREPRGGSSSPPPRESRVQEGARAGVLGQTGLWQASLGARQFTRPARRAPSPSGRGGVGGAAAGGQRPRAPSHRAPPRHAPLTRLASARSIGWPLQGAPIPAGAQGADGGRL
jgi:hypothetical protein